MEHVGSLERSLIGAEVVLLKALQEDVKGRFNDSSRWRKSIAGPRVRMAQTTLSVSQ
jgi:hypothetical protein